MPVDDQSRHLALWVESLVRICQLRNNTAQVMNIHEECSKPALLHLLGGGLPCTHSLFPSEQELCIYSGENLAVSDVMQVRTNSDSPGARAPEVGIQHGLREREVDISKENIAGEPTLAVVEAILVQSPNPVASDFYKPRLLSPRARAVDL